MSLSETLVQKDLSVTHGSDEHLFVEFYFNPAKGNKPYIHIAIPGDKTTDIRRAVKETDKVRFPRHWEAFERGLDQIEAGGMALEEWAALDEGRRMELRAMNIFTVEQVASLADGVLKQVGMDARTLRDKAREIVATKQAPARVDQLEADKADLQAQIDELRVMVEGRNGAEKGEHHDDGLSPPKPSAGAAPAGKAAKKGAAQKAA